VTIDNVQDVLNTVHMRSYSRWCKSRFIRGPWMRIKAINFDD